MVELDPLDPQKCWIPDRFLSQVASGIRRKRRPSQFGQDGMGSIPATPSTKHASCFPPSSLPASIEIAIKLVVCLSVGSQIPIPDPQNPIPILDSLIPDPLNPISKDLKKY